MSDQIAGQDAVSADAEQEFRWWEYAVGGMWEQMGRLQFDFLIAQGLRPHHYLLDVGCGSLRAGVKVLPYLEPGHYYGIDISQEILDAGWMVVEREGLQARAPRLVRMDDFNFASLGRAFDFALAQSVFTHVPLNSIIRCLMNIDKVLAPGGRFFATFFENPRGKFCLDPLEPAFGESADGLRFQTYFDRDPYHYDVDTFRWICEGTGLRVDYIGGWNHPRDQRMLAFVKTS
jgi:SAM-dependent methyltransferase